MVWFWVWTALVVATVAGAFFLLRDVWRRAAALGAELARASAVAEELARRTEQLLAAAQEAEAVRRATPVDLDAVRLRRATMREDRVRRRARRHERHLATREGWRDYWR